MATFIDNYREAMPKLKNMNLIQKSNAIAGLIRDNARIAKENREAVAQNTFQRNADGTNYGVGIDGKTYVYTVGLNNKMSEPKELSAEEQIAAINEVTGGRINVDPAIKNQQSLTDIFRSVSRMYNNGGNLVPDKTTISDMNPDSYNVFGAQGRSFKSRDDTPDEVEINGLDFPKYRKATEKEDYESGFASSGKYPGEHVPTHELSHTADFATSRIIDKWLYEKQQEAEKNKNKYTVNELLKKTINDFFGRDYELDESKSMGTQLLTEVYNKYNKWTSEDKRNNLENYTENFFDIAAKNSGFDSVNDAAASISGYAGKTYPHDFKMYGKEYHYDDVDKKEVFAEAYTDVLINGNDAKQFSKELIKLWSDYADRWADRTGQNKTKRTQEFKQMFQVLPDFKTNSQKSPSNLFIQNYRNAPWKYKK